MPNLGEILNQAPELAAATTQQRQQVLDKVYEGMKASGQVSSGKLRQFRQDQMDAFLSDDDKDKNKPYKEPTYERTGKPLPGQGGYTHIDNMAGGSSILGANISQYLPEDRETYSKLARRNTLEDLRDVGRIASNPEQIQAGFKKTIQDLIGLGMAAWASSGGMEAAGLRLVNKETGESYTPSFTESLNKFNQLDSVKETNKWYEEVIKDDPELSKRYHAVVTDAALGAAFGIGRAAKAGQALADVGAVKTGLSKMREFFAPVVSNVVGGQLVYSGLEGLDNAIKDVDLPDETKTGIRIGAVLAAGIASGIGPERWIENVITNNSQAVNLATELGKVAKVAEKSGVDFKTALAQNPELSDEAKRVLGIEDVIDPTTGQNLNATTIQDKVAQVTEVTDRLATGQDLAIEDAAIAKTLGPEVPLSPMKPEEMAEDLGGLSSQPAAVREPKPRTYIPSRTSEIGQRQERAPLTWDSISLSRQALESLDMLTSSGRATQEALKRAVESGNTELAAQLTQQIKTIQGQVEDAQKLITLEMGGSRDLIRLVNQEIKSIDTQLKDLRNEWRASELQAKRAELEAKAAALKERQQRMQDRKTVFQRIPAKADKDLLQRLKNERDARVFGRVAEPSKPWSPKIAREDAETQLSMLPEAERFRAMKISQAAQLGTEDILGRSLTEPERLDILANVLSDRKAWSNNPWTPHTEAVFSSDGVQRVWAGYVGERYPLVSQVLSVLHSTDAAAGAFTPDQVLQLAQSLTARSGLGMDSQGWQLSRDIISQSYHLWDDVRSALPKAKGDNLRSFLSTAMPGSRSTTVKKVADTITKAFPELDLSFQMDALPKGVAATADALSKMVTVGLNKVELKELMHEIGHLNFWHGLDADTRLAWMDGMRGRANDEVSWANAFPEYAERQMANAELDEVARANSEFWLQNPSEMYAQQFSAYTLSNVLPTVETLSTFQRAWRGLKRTMGLATDNWETLPTDTRQMLIKTLTAPEPIEARLIPSADIEEGLKGSWLYSDKDIAEPRVFEIRQMLEGTYGQRLERIPSSELLISDVVQEGPQVSFFSLPVEQRVASYALNDLPQVAEMQALSILHDLPGADWNELRGVLSRLHESLKGDRRAELLDGIVASQQKVSSPYDREFDPSVGQYYSPQELADARRTTALNEYNRLDSASKNVIAADNARKYKREWMRRKEVARQTLTEEKDSGRIDSFTEQDVNNLADRLWDERPGNAIEGRAMANYQEANEVATTTDQLYSQAEKQLAALDVMTDDLTDFTKYVLASKGMVEAIEPSFAQRLSKAEMYSRIASGQSNWRWPELMWKTGVQGAYVALTGLEYDPEGTYVPFLGTVKWSPEKFFETAPLGVLLLPGGWRGAKWAGRQGAKVAKPIVDKALTQIPVTTRIKMENMAKTFNRAFIMSGGLPTDLSQAMRNAQIYGQSKKQDFYAFAETMHRHFTPEERETIAKIYEQRPGIDQLILETAENRPDIMAAVEMTRKLYSTIPGNFKELGLWSKNFEDLGDHYINRFYDGIGKKPTSAIFLNYNISPIRGNFLKRRGLEAVVKNGKTAEAGESSIDALTQLRNNAKDAGVELREGLKLNSWEAQDGTILYSIPGSAYDDSLRAQKLVPMYQWDNAGTGYVLTEVRKNSYKVRRDYTVKEREGMGEVVDVAVRSAAMGEQLERDLRQGRAFYNVANSSYAKRVEDPEEAKSLIEQGWTLVEDTLDKQIGLKKYGALSGMYIHPDAKTALQSIGSGNIISKWLEANDMGKALKVHRKLLNAWKISKTVLSPVAHMNNFVSNMFMGHLMGHNVAADLSTGLRMSSIRNMEIRAKQLAKEGKYKEAQALSDKMRQHEYYPYFAEMRDARMSDSSLWATELNSDDLVQELRRANLDSAGSDLGKLQKYMSAGYNALESAWKKSTKFAGGWYEKGDLIYKMGAFVNARKQGRTANEAVKYAYEAYFDYGNLSPVARALRDSGIVPFVSYLYNAIPALAKSVTQHPERVAGIALMLEGLHLASIGAMYGPEDLITKREAVDAAMPEYMQRRGLGGIFRTRILNPFGSSTSVDSAQGDIAKHQFLDITRMIPGGDLIEAKSGVNDVDFSLNTAGELLYRFINQSPVMGILGAAATGVDQLGRSLVSGGNVDTSITRERTSEAFNDLVYNTLMPNLPFIPGTPTYKAITDALKPTTGFEWGDSTGLDAMGLPKSLGVAISGSFGLKFRDVYPEVSLSRQIDYLEGQMKKEESRLRRIFDSPMYTDEYKERELRNLEQTAKEVEKRQVRRVELLQRLSDARRAAQGGQTLPH